MVARDNGREDWIWFRSFELIDVNRLEKIQSLYFWLVFLQHGGVASVGRLWAVLVLWWKYRGLGCVVYRFYWGLVGRQQSLILFTMWDVTIFSNSPRRRLPLWPFVDCFIRTPFFMIGNFMISWKKKELFNCEFTFTFQPDGYAEFTYAATSSICYKPSFRLHPVNLTNF